MNIITKAMQHHNINESYLLLTIYLKTATIKINSFVQCLVMINTDVLFKLCCITEYIFFS